MLYSIPELKLIDGVPHAEDYRGWRASLDRVDRQAFDRIHQALDLRFEDREVDTSSWIPGTDWTGTVFAPKDESN